MPLDRQFLSALIGKILGAAILVAVILILGHKLRTVSTTDPDQYFHLAVSRMEAQSGLLRALPQAEDLGWQSHFPEKEFLFHRVTTLLYKIGGEPAVLWTIPLLVSAIVLTLFFTASGTSIGLSLPLSLFWVIAFTFLSPHFYYRMLFLRPHLLAIALFLGILVSLLSANRWLCLLFSLLFPLAYHAVYMPLFVLLLGLAVAWIFSIERWKKPVIFGLLGVIAGVRLNPYYPENLQMMFTHIGLTGDPQLNLLLDAGIELFPLPMKVYLLFYALHWVGVLACVAVLAKSWRSIRSDRLLQGIVVLSVVATTFLVLTAISPRATEYATPTSALLFCSLFAYLLRAGVLPRWGAWASSCVLVALGCWIGLPSFYFTYSGLWNPPKTTDSAEVLKAVSVLPADRPAKVFHCVWSHGSYILYERPNLKFIDLLDPHFLLEESLEKVVTRAKIGTAQIDDPLPPLKEMFKADYVLCEDRRLNARLAGDPRFKQLYPATRSVIWPAWSPAVFEILPLGTASSALRRSN